MEIFFKAKWALFVFAVLYLPSMIYGQDAKPLALEIAVDIAMKNNPRVLAAQKELAAARGRSWVTWWLQDPRFEVEYEQIPTGKGLGSFGERRFTFTQSIDFPTNMLFKKKLANNDVDLNRMELAKARLSVRADVKIAYINYLTKRDQVRLAQENLQLAREFLEKATTRYDVGEAPRLEVVRTRVAAALAENDVTRAQSNLTAAQAALNALLARPAGATVTVTDSLTYQTFETSLSDLRQQAFNVHPRLRAAGYQVGMASQLRNLAWGNFLPSIEASAFKQTIDGNSGFCGIQVGLSVPLWFPFRQRGNIQEARGVLHASQWRRQNIKNLLDADIESAYAAVQSDRKQVEKYIDTLLEQTEEVYRIALRSYEEGEVGYLQLLEAQQTLINVRRGYIDALGSYHNALSELERATGISIE